MHGHHARGWIAGLFAGAALLAGSVHAAELTATYTGQYVYLHLLGSYAQYTVKRADTGDDFRVLEFNQTGCTSQCTYDDFAIAFGSDYEYMIEVLRPDGEFETFGPVRLTIDEDDGLSLGSRAVPNPITSGDTAIRFTMPATIVQTGTISTSVTILDPAGRVVKRVWADEVGLGEYEVGWDGTDEAGRDLPSGSYFYSIRTGPHVESGRMILLR